MEDEEVWSEPDPLTKHRARLSKALWAVILAMLTFIIAFAVYSFSQGINRYRIEGVTSTQLQAEQPNTAAELVKIIAPDHNWSEAVLVCPYADPKNLPTYAAEAATQSNLRVESEALAYWITNGEQRLIVRGDRGEVDFCGGVNNTGQIIMPKSMLEISKKADVLYVEVHGIE
ncbi:hypothetical protein NXS08_06630 [Gleimia sp. 6138-11-ORH1]|uniref:hypothetical protein n=1 Tax=Gleimia sp. 6138-11-ORH1 TaxID=2973937 RepID=UPI00216A9443|nr:hypothetical protein [Gleimia sp. 6138-11-ORH1]MCS4485138.1 hypothetical protein [Gleimia sp. 6138-11-ORH1]